MKAVVSHLKLTQYKWLFDLTFLSLRWCFLVVLFTLLFWVWITSNYTKHKQLKHFYTRKCILRLTFHGEKENKQRLQIKYGKIIWRFFGFKIQTCEFTKIWIHQRSKFIEYLIEFIEIILFFEILNSLNCWIRRNTKFH